MTQIPEVQPMAGLSGSYQSDSAQSSIDQPTVEQSISGQSHGEQSTTVEPTIGIPEELQQPSARSAYPGVVSAQPVSGLHPTSTAPVHAQPLQQTPQEMPADPYLTDVELARANDLLGRVNSLFREKIVGQKELRESLVASLLSRGHVLVESVPGLAKTTAAQTLAQSVSGSFHRIQCTPDLMPNDIVGTQVFNPSSGKFTTQLGPVHANFVLLDEINRSSAKTQSAMLEAMQEGQTTIGGENFPLPKPFMVMATQNPIEEEGTYVLPEAQMDRFLMKVVITYPSRQEELKVLEMIDDGAFRTDLTGDPITIEELEELQGYTSRVYVHKAIKTYIVDLANTTRGGGPNPLPGLSQHVRLGSSPRGGIALMKVAQAVALMQGRNYVIPDDVKAMRYSVLRHRIVRTWDAVADNVQVQGIIDAAFQAVPVP